MSDSRGALHHMSCIHAYISCLLCYIYRCMCADTLHPEHMHAHTPHHTTPFLTSQLTTAVQVLNDHGDISLCLTAPPPAFLATTYTENLNNCSVFFSSLPKTAQLCSFLPSSFAAVDRRLETMVYSEQAFGVFQLQTVKKGCHRCLLYMACLFTPFKGFNLLICMFLKAFSVNLTFPEHRQFDCGFIIYFSCLV